MKNLLFILTILGLTLSLGAQTNPVVRLALVSGSDAAAPAADLLTAQLSGNPQIQLLERDQIAKVSHEQGLSAANTDYIKLGQLLGADGLLLFQADITNYPVDGPTVTLRLHLVAVQPGVVLAAEKFSWTVKQGPAEWAQNFAGRMAAWLPKLSVRSKDAIPLSIVNLRSAVASRDAEETERQLKLLTIERLSREPQIFVLERQQLDKLAGEKELQTDDAAFWNGSYLLDGVVDQQGYSPDTVTINARLTPPKGGAPLALAVSGSRTNLAEVINQLAARVDAALKLQSVVPAWNSADEAAQYLAEAKWGERWGLCAEAQAAAESAWALGQQDLECALVRVKAYVMDVSANAVKYQAAQSGLSSGFDANGRPQNPDPSDARLQELLDEIHAVHPLARIVKITRPPGSREVTFVYPDRPPEAGQIDEALRALDLYEQFSRTSPDGEPQILSRGKGWDDWRNSEWYQLGIDDLVAASRVLRSYNFTPDAQNPVADKLADLRARARSVAQLIARAPTVHDSYYVGDRIVSHDELDHAMREQPNIFRCETDWGCFWQETPEDTVALYRELLASPVFCYLHGDLWQPQPDLVRLTAWNPEDQKRLPAVWAGFVSELAGSTNVLWQMEAKALAMADAPAEDEAKADRSALLDLIRAHHAELVGNNVELFYQGWGLGFNDPELDALDQEYWNTTYTGNTPKARQSDFEKKRRYFQDNTPYDFFAFANLFDSHDFTPDEARELLPLATNYQAGLAGREKSATGMAQLQLKGAVAQVQFLINALNHRANPPAPAPPATPAPAPSAPAQITRPKPAGPPAPLPPENVTNILTVDQFLKLPLGDLPGDHISQVTFTAHHWLEGKLVLDFKYGAFLYTYDANGNWQSTHNATLPGIAILDPAAATWRVASCPETDITTQNRYYHHTTLLHGELYTCDGGQIRKYDFPGRTWQALPVSDGENYELFNVGGHLYAANGTLIFEITDGGKSSRILASTRRQPPASALDSADLGAPVLFPGPANSLRAATPRGVYRWTGSDWRQDAPAPALDLPAAIVPEGVLFRDMDSVSRLLTDAAAPELCLGGISRLSPGSPAEPRWKLPPQTYPASLAAALCESNLCLLAGHSTIHQTIDDTQHVTAERVEAQDGYNAALLVFFSDLPAPLQLYLNFDAPQGRPPLGGLNSHTRQFIPSLPPAFLLFAGDNLLFAGENSGLVIPMAVENPGADYQAGVWVLPLARLNPLITAQKQAALAQLAQAAAAHAEIQKNLLAQYDLNHNGVLDPDERETALTDPDFIAAELDDIDTNHNGWLDAPELAWFDANQNKVLDPQEQKGIELARHLLAQRLFEKFAPGGGGGLGQGEFNELIQSSLQTGPNAEPDLQFYQADENHDGHVDAGELEDLMQLHLDLMLRARRTSHGLSMPYFRNMSPSANDGQSFATTVENYWQRGVQSGQPPFGGMQFGQPPFGRFGGYPPGHSGPATAPPPLSPSERAAMEQFQQAFLKKYDHNHNGVLDPDEQSAARDDLDYGKYMINRLRLRQPTTAGQPNLATPP